MRGHAMNDLDCTDEEVLADELQASADRGRGYIGALEIKIDGMRLAFAADAALDHLSSGPLIALERKLAIAHEAVGILQRRASRCRIVCLVGTDK